MGIPMSVLLTRAGIASAATTVEVHANRDIWIWSIDTMTIS
jgi:hypothetical protein